MGLRSAKSMSSKMRRVKGGSALRRSESYNHYGMNCSCFMVGVGVAVGQGGDG